MKLLLSPETFWFSQVNICHGNPPVGTFSTCSTIENARLFLNGSCKTQKAAFNVFVKHEDKIIHSREFPEHKLFHFYTSSCYWLHFVNAVFGTPTDLKVYFRHWWNRTFWEFVLEEEAAQPSKSPAVKHLPRLQALPRQRRFEPASTF